MSAAELRELAETYLYDGDADAPRPGYVEIYEFADRLPAAPSVSTDHTDDALTLAHVVAALSVTYRPEGVLIWLDWMRRTHSTDPAVLAEHVRRLGDADPAGFTIKEARDA